jgi:glycosyltransferase involved in cell wall biosynthesis
MKPDMIYVHGLQTPALITAKRYKMKNPDVVFVADSHADFNNSASNFISRQFLHKLYYKKIINNSFDYLDEIYAISYEALEFLNRVYDLPSSSIKLLPLGGIILSEDHRNDIKRRIREKMGFTPEDIIIIHTGKLDHKKRTIDLLSAFSNVRSNFLKLIIVGSIDKTVNKVLMSCINSDNRVNYVGWMPTIEMIELIHAADLYVQPGGQSATMQAAACAGCALAIYPFRSHKYLMEESVFYINSEKDIISLFEIILEDRQLLEIMKKKSLSLSLEKLDYTKQVNEILSLMN